MLTYRYDCVDSYIYLDLLLRYLENGDLITTSDDPSS